MKREAKDSSRGVPMFVAPLYLITSSSDEEVEIFLLVWYTVASVTP